MSWTGLHKATVEGHASCVEVLIARGASVEAKTDDGETPLVVAKFWSKQEVVELLESAGAQR